MSAVKYGFLGHFFFFKQNNSCELNVQGSFAKTGKYHQKVITTAMGLLKALGQASFPLVLCSTECPGSVIRVAQLLIS